VRFHRVPLLTRVVSNPAIVGYGQEENVYAAVGTSSRPRLVALYIAASMARGMRLSISVDLSLSAGHRGRSGVTLSFID